MVREPRKQPLKTCFGSLVTKLTLACVDCKLGFNVAAASPLFLPRAVLCNPRPETFVNEHVHKS